MERLAQAISFQVALMAIMTSTPAVALNEDQIQQAIQLGLQADDVKKAPAFLQAGTKFPKGSLGRSMMLGTSEPPYVFLVRSCRQWVANLAFQSRIDQKEIDRELIRKECLGQDKIRVAVISNAGVNEAVSRAGGYLPVPAQPVV